MVKIILNTYENCTSTNDLAIENASKGLPEGNSYLSINQSKGRGRNDNQWSSLKGNIFLSTILRPKKNKLIWYQLSLIAGYSVLITLKTLGVDNNLLELKWPNDVLIDKKKVSGVLLETVDDFLIIGIGVNILNKPYKDVKWKTAKLNDFISINLSNEDLSMILLKNIFKYYSIWNKFELTTLLTNINPYLKNVGKKIIYKTSLTSQNEIGVFVGLSKNGGIQILKDKNIYEFLSLYSFIVTSEVI